MQEWCDDYSGMEDGCCLNCPDAEYGCLCYACCCKKCYWYIPPEEYDGEKGRCALAVKRRIKREQKRDLWIDNFTKNIQKKREESLSKKEKEQKKLGDKW